MKTFLSSTIGAKLPQHLHDILIGYMLGDGGIFYASKNSAFPRFEFSMGQDRLAFAQHLASLFAFYASNTLKEVKVQASTDLRSEHSGDWYTSYRFKTRSIEVFSYYRSMFYVVNPVTGRGVKVVPTNIEELLTPVALAYLIMADGNYDAGRNRVRIYTNSFTYKDVVRLAQAIKANFGVYVGVMEDSPRKNQYILTIGANELAKLKELVLPHMLPSMKYRIGE